ncbi:MAG: FKBP-type peptidyl-prolyl cis-trans isomerase [Flavobacteriaceae bacterium]|nr:FKBP-type peptidyl-prolyl cis-trans isomerase [Flavobacteriaceae bacterium]
MKKISLWLLFCLLVACSQNQQVYPPVGGLSKEELSVSQNRAKQLNEMEREQIQSWIAGQDKKFHPTPLNYWSDKDLAQRKDKKNDGEVISFQYEIYDFDGVKFYDKPKIYEEVVLGKFKEIEAIEDAVKYLNLGEEVLLLVPSILAYGTYGDGDQIPHDMPLIVNLKRIK